MRTLRPRPPAAAPTPPAATVTLVAALVMALLAGCAGQSPSGQASGGTSTGPSTEATGVPTLPTVPPTVPPPLPPTLQPTAPPKTLPPGGSPPGQPGEVTVRGAVQEGVEAGCLLLLTDNGTQYLLLGGDRQVLRSGAAVVVQGRPQPGLATTCQQGTPFAVSSAKPDVAGTS